MKPSFVLSFKKNISIIEQSPTHVIVQSPLIKGNIPQNTLNFDQISPGLLAAIRTLSTDGRTEEQLSQLVLQNDGSSALPIFYYYLQSFINLGMICHSIFEDESPLAIRVPISRSDKFQFKEVEINQKYVLSRFAYSRKEQGHLVIESPLSQAQIILTDWRGAALLTELANPQVVSRICTKIPGISEKTIQLFFSLLLSVGMLSEVKENGEVQEEGNEALVQWEFHDLLFHSRTRTGRHSNPVGKTFRFLNKIQQPPVFKPKVWDTTIDLYKPDIQKLIEFDYPFTLVLEERKSIRSYENEPITDQEVGEFLYRSARSKGTFAKDYGECSIKPYANSGGRYELEFYLTVNTCKNIPSGLYYYCSEEHQLCRVAERNSDVEALLEEASLATGKACIPQILITIAARFQRASWAYESIAYAGILKNVGALQQTMYLVATAMHLAPCAIGCGNADLFAVAIGTDYSQESSVGEFILGSVPNGLALPTRPHISGETAEES